MSALDTKPAPETEQVSLLDYIIVLVKHSGMIVYTTIAVTAITLLVVLILPNKYRATARLLPPTQHFAFSSKLIDNLGIADSPGSLGSSFSKAESFLLLKTPGDIFVGILNSDTITDTLIEQFDLKNIYCAKYIEDARKELDEKTEITTTKDGIITIEVTDNDRQRVASLANAYAEELDKMLRLVTNDEAKNYLEFLEKERLQANNKLSQAEDSLRTFSEKANVLQIDTQARSAIQYIATLRAEIDAKEVQLKVLQKQATSYNYDVIRVETELKGLKEKMRDAECKTGPGLAEVCISTDKFPAIGQAYLRLFREAKYQEVLYQLFCKMTELARLDAVRNIQIIRYVDRAKPPEKKANKRLLPTLLAGLITFCLMIPMAFVLEYWQTVRNDSQRVDLLFRYLRPYTEIYHRFKRLLRLPEK